MEKLIIENRKGQTIVGVLEIPNGEIKGTAVIQHGYGGFKEQDHIQTMKKVFLNNGWQTFNFDATNSNNESDGDYEKATLGLHHEDLEDVTKWVQKQDWFEGKLALIGHSMGGYAVARYAQEYPNEVALCAPIAPVVSGKLSIEARKRFKPDELRDWKETGWLVKESGSKTGSIKRSPWSHMEERLNHNLLPKANQLTMPVFLYVGTDDNSIPPEHVEILFDAIPEGNKTLVIAEGAPHTYRSSDDLNHLRDALSDWLSKVI